MGSEETALTVHEFAMRFTATPRGARLARRLVSQRLDVWGHPYDSRVNETMTQIAAELTANAVRHGRVPGRDFHVRLRETATGGGDGAAVVIEVSDTRDGWPSPATPVPSVPGPPSPTQESGRGLRLVSVLADDWSVVPRAGAPGKTVRAELSLRARRR
ncbi:ATP-binding protein [uncultured Streptomyces sp.]|uniref:ATP-binding protein n=1 Tax=uncultured Streptomyces sp. TaxID=174707 RepID=UPI003419BB4C